MDFSIPLDLVLPIPDTKSTDLTFLFKGITLFDDRGIDLAIGKQFQSDDKNGFVLTPYLSTAYINATNEGLIPCEGYVVIVLVDSVLLKPLNNCEILYTGSVFEYDIINVAPEMSIKYLLEKVITLLKQSQTI